jgi:hypothetical protein
MSADKKQHKIIWILGVYKNVCRQKHAGLMNHGPEKKMWTKRPGNE